MRPDPAGSLRVTLVDAFSGRVSGFWLCERAGVRFGADVALTLCNAWGERGRGRVNPRSDWLRRAPGRRGRRGLREARGTRLGRGLRFGSVPAARGERLGKRAVGLSGELFPLPRGLQTKLGVLEPFTRLGKLARCSRERAFELGHGRLVCDRLEATLDEADHRGGEAETAFCGVCVLPASDRPSTTIGAAQARPSPQSLS